MRLYDCRGQRKYLTPAEQQEFLQAAQDAPEKVRSFCATLAYTGCRISEALALTADRVDLGDGVLIFESLKKRRRGIYRAVPVPPVLLDTLDMVHEIRAARREAGRGYGVHLWDWSRATAWRRVREIMAAAGIAGLHATPKGLRHAFGIKATTSKIPLHMTQRWLGHTQLSTTSIYADAVGPEERQIAELMWER
jgi:integrase/recombinase XerD